MDITTLREKVANHHGDYMDDTQKKCYEDHLKECLKEALARLDEKNNFDASGQTRFADPSDWASHQESSSLQDFEEKNLVKIIEQIRAALRAIRDDEYGYCEKCGEPMGHKRLLSRPYALMDTDCASAEEFKEKQRLGR